MMKIMNNSPILPIQQLDVRQILLDVGKKEKEIISII
jgi:hypothetical protein